MFAEYVEPTIKAHDEVPISKEGRCFTDCNDIIDSDSRTDVNKNKDFTTELTTKLKKMEVIITDETKKAFSDTGIERTTTMAKDELKDLPLKTKEVTQHARRLVSSKKRGFRDQIGTYTESRESCETTEGSSSGSTISL